MGGVVVVGSYIFHFSKIWRSFPKLSTYISSKLCTQNSIFIFHSHLSTYTILDNRNWLMNHDLSIKCESILDNIKIQKLGIAIYTFSSTHNIHKSSCGLCFWALHPLIENFFSEICQLYVWSPKTNAARTFVNVVIWRKSISMVLPIIWIWKIFENHSKVA